MHAPARPRGRSRRDRTLAAAALVAAVLVAPLSTGGPAAAAPPCATADVATGRPALASSQENAAFPASAAVDGDPGTRWSSTFTDPQSITVDLGTTRSLCEVTLRWETAYGSAFRLKLSSTDTDWTTAPTVYSTTTGTGGTQVLPVTGTGRWLRLEGLTRATVWGYSLWEIGARALDPATPPVPTPPAGPSVKKGATLWAFPGVGTAVQDARISWYYTWSTRSPGYTPDPAVRFVPMLWGPGSVTPTGLQEVQQSPSDTLLTFNEPDLREQSNMSVEAALDLWPQVQGTGKRLVSPAVAFDGDRPGGWLDRFMSGAAARGYRVDAVALHWYGGDFEPVRATAQLRAYVEAVHARYQRPVWVTEYALMRFGPTTTPDPGTQAEFVRLSTLMLESLPYVERYAWFSFGTPTEGGLGTGLYWPDGTATPMGAAYRAAGPA